MINELIKQEHILEYISVIYFLIILGNDKIALKAHEYSRNQNFI